MYKNQTIVQIGSHIGNTSNDPLFSNMDDDTNTLILVEPVPFLFEKLKNNYNEKFGKNPHIIFINKAVSDFIGEIEMTIPSEKNDFSKLPPWASQLSSIYSDHALGHLNMLVEKIIVQTTTLDEIVKEYQLSNIDLLHTDTEGHDYTILMNYHFEIKPKKIMFEHKHMDGLCHADVKYKELLEKLASLGYKKIHQDSEDTVVILDGL